MTLCRMHASASRPFPGVVCAAQSGGLSSGRCSRCVSVTARAVAGVRAAATSWAWLAAPVPCIGEAANSWFARGRCRARGSTRYFSVRCAARPYHRRRLTGRFFPPGPWTTILAYAPAVTSTTAHVRPGSAQRTAWCASTNSRRRISPGRGSMRIRPQTAQVEVTSRAHRCRCARCRIARRGVEPRCAQDAALAARTRACPG